MTHTALTVNLGGPRQASVAQSGMLEWTHQVVLPKRPTLMFAQETFPTWLSLVRAAGYRVLEGVERGWSVRSALVVDEGIHVRRLSEQDLPQLWYHGSYVAAAVWDRPGGSQAVLASVHASPAYAEPERYGWPPDADLPESRNGGDDRRWPNHRRWDADLVLATLQAIEARFRLPLLAAGDLNESLLDDPEGGTWGREFFCSATMGGLSAWLHEEWATEPRGERATRAGLQLDHILLTEDAKALLSSDPPPALDPWWSYADRDSSELSDHTPIWFSLAP